MTEPLHDENLVRVDDDLPPLEAIAGDVHPAPPPTLTTKEEWTAYATSTAYLRPAMPTPAELKAMTQIERKRFDRRRMQHHALLGTATLFTTPPMKRIHSELFELIELNHSTIGARYAYLISGDPMLGKSTIMTSFGKRYDSGIRTRYPGGLSATGDELIPVVYCTVAGETTIKGFNRAIAEFYALPWAYKSKDALTLAIQKVARRCCTTLFLIDDIHHLDTKYRDHRLLNDHLKHLMSTVAATFVFAGIEADKGGLVRGEAGPSFWATERRIRLHKVSPFSLENKKRRAEWRGLLQAIERELLLLKAKPGDLWSVVDDGGLAMDDYLYERTGGEIGSLTELMRKAANRAIKDGSERIAKALLEKVHINQGREKHRPETE